MTNLKRTELQIFPYTSPQNAKVELQTSQIAKVELVFFALLFCIFIIITTLTRVYFLIFWLKIKAAIAKSSYSAYQRHLATSQYKMLCEFSGQGFCAEAKLLAKDKRKSNKSYMKTLANEP